MQQFFVSFIILIFAFSFVACMEKFPRMIAERFNIKDKFGKLIYVLLTLFQLWFAAYLMVDLAFSDRKTYYDLSPNSGFQFQELGNYIYFIKSQNPSDSAGIQRFPKIENFNPALMKVIEIKTFDRWNNLFRQELLLIYEQDTLEIEFLREKV